MTTPGPLWDAAYARRTDPAESHDAAARVPVTALEDRVLCALRERGPSTVPELAAYLDLRVVSVSPRMKPLTDKGEVERTGERRDGCAVWRAK